jgi:hypothetical protein
MTSWMRPYFRVGDRVRHFKRWRVRTRHRRLLDHLQLHATAERRTFYTHNQTSSIHYWRYRWRQDWIARSMRRLESIRS